MLVIWTLPSRNNQKMKWNKDIKSQKTVNIALHKIHLNNLKETRKIRKKRMKVDNKNWLQRHH